MNLDKIPQPAGQIISDFVSRLSSLKPGIIDGIYIIGSLPLDDFYSTKSDIDFLVLCRDLPNENLALQLKHIHEGMERKFQKPDLSGIYFSSDTISAEYPEKSKVLSYHEKKMSFQAFEMAPVSLSELKSHAWTILGPQANTLIINVSKQRLNEFLYENINSYWKKWIRLHSSLFQRKIFLLSFPRFTEWSVLGVARQFYTLQTGKIGSKTEAGYYCLEHLPEKFHKIIEEAISIRQDNRTYPVVGSYGVKPSFRRAKETVDVVNYIIELVNRNYNKKTFGVG